MKTKNIKQSKNKGKGSQEWSFEKSLDEVIQVLTEKNYLCKEIKYPPNEGEKLTYSFQIGRVWSRDFYDDLPQGFTFKRSGIDYPIIFYEISFSCTVPQANELNEMKKLGKKLIKWAKSLPILLPFYLAIYTFDHNASLQAKEVLEGPFEFERVVIDEKDGALIEDPVLYKIEGVRYVDENAGRKASRTVEAIMESGLVFNSVELYNYSLYAPLNEVSDKVNLYYKTLARIDQINELVAKTTKPLLSALIGKEDEVTS